jgi:pimeloyl-ACP methyl ester carboxylesterase
MSGTNFTQRKVEVDGRTLRYLEAGSGETLVSILDEIGEFPSHAHAAIAERRRLLAFVPPGDTAAAAPLFARKVAAALEILGIERFDLMGHGAGAAVALSLALDRPAAVGAIALVAPTALGDDGKETDRRLAELKCPVLALFGTKDPIAPPEHGDRYRALLPDCHLMFVYDAAHAIATERPEALGFIALEFFERRDLFLVNRDSGMAFP